jgi:hypothetical protein
MNNKFDGISIHMTSLRESHDRRKKITDQFSELGIKNFEFFVTNRVESINPHIAVISKYPEYSWNIRGVTITHLEMMRHWYLTTNEPYAIFCEDDNDFSTSKYWNFTIQEFIQNLPSDWECVHLMRYKVPPDMYGPHCHDSILKIFLGRYWGTCALMNRGYVKKCLDTHVRGLEIYDLRIITHGFYPEPMNPNLIEYVENVLYLNKGIVYNFPLVTQLSPYECDTTHKHFTVNHINEGKRIMEINRRCFMDLWEKHGKSLNLKEALTIS